MPKRKHVLFRVKCRHSTVLVASALGFGFKWKIVYFLCLYVYKPICLATPSMSFYRGSDQISMHSCACMLQAGGRVELEQHESTPCVLSIKKRGETCHCLRYVTGESRNGRSVRVRIYLFTSCQKKRCMPAVGGSRDWRTARKPMLPPEPRQRAAAKPATGDRPHCLSTD